MENIQNPNTSNIKSIAMYDEMLYVSSEDQIRTYDIKQMRLDRASSQE